MIDLLDEAKKAQEYLNEVFYKPGWKFDVVTNHNGNYLRLTCRVLDSTTYPIDPNKMVDVVQYSAIYPMIVEYKDEFYKWLQSEIFRLERHESQEWLRSFEDGKPLDDPHAHDRR